MMSLTNRDHRTAPAVELLATLHGELAGRIRHESRSGGCARDGRPLRFGRPPRRGLNPSRLDHRRLLTDQPATPATTTTAAITIGPAGTPYSTAGGFTDSTTRGSGESRPPGVAVGTPVITAVVNSAASLGVIRLIGSHRNDQYR